MSVRTIQIEFMKVLHKYEGTDKVYVLAIQKDEDEGNHNVVVYYGKRLLLFKDTLLAQTKGVYKKFWEATERCKELFATKIKEGFVDILDATYNAPEKLVFEEVAERLHFSDPPIEVSVEDKESEEIKIDKSECEIEVICNSNLGMEEDFDEGGQYLAKDDGETFIIVENRFGKFKKCFKNRFGGVK